MIHGVLQSSLLSFVLRFVSVLAACISFSTRGADGSCGFPALFGFGSSLSDVGNGALGNPIIKMGIRTPDGSTYFGGPANRFCDGRLAVDFVALSVGLPLTKPYLAYKTAGTDFSQGVNYAVSGATTQGAGYLLSRGDVAFVSFSYVKSQVQNHISIAQAAQSPGLAASSYPGVTLPSPNAIANGLYFLEFGGNDYGSYFLSKYSIRPGTRGMNIDNSFALSTLVPAVVKSLADGIEDLYAIGARNFLIYSVLPEGCVPLFLSMLNGTKDANGCLADLNAVDISHDQQFSVLADGLRSKYPDINLMEADAYGAWAKLFQSPDGFTELINACCGAGPGFVYQFKLASICGPTTYVCPDPSKYVVWDGVHPTDAMNRYLINSVVSGGYLNPANALACASPV